MQAQVKGPLGLACEPKARDLPYLARIPEPFDGAARQEVRMVTTAEVLHSGSSTPYNQANPGNTTHTTTTP
ncbi:hypothetical protein V6N12_011081 [Hibiscus sabdariffa]|uniref:Uncharacterized protein n=1 Tax=Hibiscus sabdariffa TaxID=183260 RepID=A0ABR2ELZ8_9ROSI